MKVFLVNCLTLKRSNPHESLGKKGLDQKDLCSTEHQCPRTCRYSRLRSHHKDWKKYSRAPHPPTRRDPSLPGRWVRCASPAQPTHPPRGQHPAAGCCPPPRWAETNYPSVINQLPARASPFLFMTEATSMVPCVIAIVHVNNYK